MDIALNSHGVNSEIKAHILSDEKMQLAGFRNNENNWYYFYLLKFPNTYRFAEISFSVTIPKDGSDIEIDVLDEDFLQPYDYQRFLSNNPQHEFANLVKTQVEEQMSRLQDLGILSGHKYGEYI